MEEPGREELGGVCAGAGSQCSWPRATRILTPQVFEMNGDDYMLYAGLKGRGWGGIRRVAADRQ